MGVIDSTLLVKVTVGFNFFGNAHVAVAVAMQKQEEPKKYQHTRRRFYCYPRLRSRIPGLIPYRGLLITVWQVS